MGKIREAVADLLRRVRRVYADLEELQSLCQDAEWSSIADSVDNAELLADDLRREVEDIARETGV